jgi:hypothetical protein
VRAARPRLARPPSRSVYPPPMASAELSRRVEKVVGYPPLSELDEPQRRIPGSRCGRPSATSVVRSGVASPVPTAMARSRRSGSAGGSRTFGSSAVGCLGRQDQADQLLLRSPQAGGRPCLHRKALREDLSSPIAEPHPQAGMQTRRDRVSAIGTVRSGPRLVPGSTTAPHVRPIGTLRPRA